MYVTAWRFAVTLQKPKDDQGYVRVHPHIAGPSKRFYTKLHQHPGTYLVGGWRVQLLAPTKASPLINLNSSPRRFRELVFFVWNNFRLFIVDEPYIPVSYWLGIYLSGAIYKDGDGLLSQFSNLRKLRINEKKETDISMRYVLAPVYPGKRPILKPEKTRIEKAGSRSVIFRLDCD